MLAWRWSLVSHYIYMLQSIEIALVFSVIFSTGNHISPLSVKGQGHNNKAGDAGSKMNDGFLTKEK